jgi:mitochondrial fission protein ELM1
MDWLRGRFPPGEHLPDPHFLIGAGRRTHLPLLAARRARGGRAVVLMRPGLPAAWFDRCLVPDHDRPRPRANLLVTRGPLNRAVPGTGARRGPGVILVGGASRHYAWPEAQILADLRFVLARRGAIWIVTDSPRTPAAFRAALREIAGEAYVAWEECGPDWLPARLAEAPEAWVTADSLSMIYEALTAGAAVGIVDLPLARRRSRAAVALDDLAGRGWVTRVCDRPQEAALPRPPEILAEADRCAAILLDELLPCR